MRRAREVKLGQNRDENLMQPVHESLDIHLGPGQRKNQVTDKLSGEVQNASPPHD